MIGLLRLKPWVEEIWSLMGLYLSHQAGARERAVLARLATLIRLGLRTCHKKIAAYACSTCALFCSLTLDSLHKINV